MMTQFQKTVCEHSIRVITEGSDSVQTFSADRWICTDSRDESKNTDGISHLYASDHMIISIAGQFDHEQLFTPVNGSFHNSNHQKDSMHSQSINGGCTPCGV